MALERPDLVGKVIADSFDGRTLADDFSINLQRERAFAKSNEFSRQFYEWCQGKDWETVVDLNTQALIEFADSKLPLFQKPLETLEVPVLLMGSLEDDMCRKDLLEEYREMSERIPESKIYFFEKGGHPAIGTNAENAAKIIIDYINE